MPLSAAPALPTKFAALGSATSKCTRAQAGCERCTGRLCQASHQHLSHSSYAIEGSTGSCWRPLRASAKTVARLHSQRTSKASKACRLLLSDSPAQAADGKLDQRRNKHVKQERQKEVVCQPSLKILSPDPHNVDQPASPGLLQSI